MSDAWRAGEVALEHADMLETLLGAHADVSGLLDRSAVLRDTAAAIREQTGLDCGLASSVENDVTVIRGWSGDMVGGLRMLEVPIGMGLGGRAVATGSPQWVNDYCSSPDITHQFDSVIRAERFGDMLAVPMIHRGEIIGVAYACHRSDAAVGDQLIEAIRRITAPATTTLFLAQRVDSHATSAVAAERQRLAVSLHDSVGALLFNLGAEVRDMQGDGDAPPALVAKLRAVEAQVAATAAAFRQSLDVLHDVAPDQSLTATVRGDCDAFQRRTGIGTRCIALTTLSALDPARTAAAVAMVREALVNVEKHAQASSVVVSLMSAGEGVALVVADDGVGWNDPHLTRSASHDDRSGPRSADSTGIGLPAVHDRLARVGGALSIVTNDDGGLTVRAWLPTV